MYVNQSVLEIDLAKISKNYDNLRKSISGKIEISAVVKANAYGLGMVEIATKLCRDNGCNKFFVANIDEAINLRNAIGRESYIFVLSGVFDNDYNELYQYNLIPILNNLKQVQIWNNYAGTKATRLPALLHINTGLNRVGFCDKEVDSLINKPELLQNIELLYIMSHLAAGDDCENEYNNYQLSNFKNYLHYFKNIKASLTASGILCGDDYYFDLLRPGAVLYGIGNYASLDIQNPVSLTAPIVHIQELKTGEHIGYDMTFTTKKNSVIATIPLGYADGYFRSLTNKGKVFIESHELDIVGRISMDFITIDITNIPREKIFLGQKVEIIGDNCTPDYIARIINTHGRDVTSALGNRYKRVYKC